MFDPQRAAGKEEGPAEPSEIAVEEGADVKREELGRGHGTGSTPPHGRSRDVTAATWQRDRRAGENDHGG